MQHSKERSYESPEALYQALTQKGTRIPAPSNPSELIRRIETDSIEMPRNELPVSFKEAFTVTTYLMWLSYRAKLREQRKAIAATSLQTFAGKKRSFNGERKENDDKTSDNVGVDQTVTIKSEKLTKLNCVPDYARNCRSGVIRAAATLFCLSGSNFAAQLAGARDSVKLRAFLQALYAEDGLTTSETVERILGMSRNELRQIPMPGPEVPYGEQTQRLIVQTLMELSETLADKSYGKLAAALNEEAYIKLTRIYITHGVCGTVYPYEHLFQRYLKECVAPKRVEQEQKMIMKQFAVDPKSIITFILDEIEEAGQRREKKRVKRSAGATEANAVFVESEKYEVFRGPINYRNDLVMRNIRHGDRFFWVITYNDCLYDVIGSSVDPNAATGQPEQNGVEHALTQHNKQRDMRVYNHLPWSSRLKLVPFRGKIGLQKMTGEELNRFQGSASLTVSWMENGYETNRTVNVRNDVKRTAIINSHCPQPLSVA